MNRMMAVVAALVVGAGGAAAGEPRLGASLRVPETAAPGDHITYVYTVHNTGDARADDVRITVAVVRSWSWLSDLYTNTPPGGSGQSIAPGATATTALGCPADGVGTITLRLTATAANGATATARATVQVRGPRLTATFTGPAALREGEDGTFRAKVTNTGNETAEGVDLAFVFGPGLRVADGVHVLGSLDDSGEGFRGHRLHPGRSVELVFEAEGRNPGRCDYTITAIAKGGATAAAGGRTLVVANLPGLHLGVVDTADPVRPGGETVYEITVSNAGTGTARNLTVTCELPPGLKLVTATGPTDYLCRVGVDFNDPKRANQPGAVEHVTFDPIRELGPKTVAVFKVKVRAERPGEQRARVGLTADHLKTPLAAEESTTVGRE